MAVSSMHAWAVVTVLLLCGVFTTLSSAQFNPKLQTYSVITEYAATASGAECTEFVRYFTSTAKILSPTGTAAKTAEAFCTKVWK